MAAVAGEREHGDSDACRSHVVQASAAERRPRVDPARAVKRYVRPAAGAPPADAATLRPLPTLRVTVDYLLRVWSERTDVAPLVRYVFVADRLRAVQQDLTVQRLHCGELLARIVRFHLLMEVGGRRCRSKPPRR